MPSSKCSLDLLLGLGILCLIPSLLRAQEPNEWPQSMFDSLSHDFGVVAKGSDVRHRFKITNRSSEDVHIASVTASCGCTGAKCDRFLLERNVSTVLEVSVDTNRFQRQKESSVTVSFDRPRAASVAIPVKAYIRPDIVVADLFSTKATIVAAHEGGDRSPDALIKNLVWNDIFFLYRK